MLFFSSPLWAVPTAALAVIMALVAPSDGFKLYDGYYNSLFRPMAEQSFKAKVETLGAILKRHVQQLRSTENKQVDLVFLVDSSASVGGVDFKEEIKFVRKLLADFTVDVNTTRVAVITFSSREKVVRAVDHLTFPDDGNHKCSLMSDEIPKIKYVGGGTFTLGAFLEAGKVLRAARKDAMKAVFLITDGFSNGGDPRPEARKLRQQGVKIFTFGIRNGNVRELFEMSSEPRNETCYVLGSFEEFEALARRALHSDLHSGTYISQPAKKCSRLCFNDGFCCHANASCTCGTHTGQYECLCKPGFYGNGLGKDGCRLCPAGTYKNHTGSGDVSMCSRCPDENQETAPGATLVHECRCKRGFRNFNSTECTVFRCSELREPDNGYFVNNQCHNVFNAACGLRCRPGYELRGSGLRICQEDGTWSGQDTTCVLKTCPALPQPKHGHMVCTTDDFRYPTVCRFTCQAGYQLLGSRKRSCLAIAFWTGIAARCREITCPPLPEIRDGMIQPAACSEEEVSFGTTCQISCLGGYQLQGPPAKQCTPDGTWSATSREANLCTDNTPPYMQCPGNIEILADPENDTTEVTWSSPVAVDNSGFIPVLTSDPAVVPPAHFPIGITIVTYQAEDLSENVAKCRFFIHVEDKTPPRVDKCSSPDPVVSTGSHGNVTWEEPVFSDNSGVAVEMVSSHSPGQFPQGHTEVTYTAFDNSGNNNTCTLDVHVTPHSCQLPEPPVNGERECHEGEEGVHCKLTCHEGHAFVVAPPPEYFCAYDNVWTPSDRMPFPDCAAQQISSEVQQPASITLTGDLACAEHKLLNRVQQNIEAKVNDKMNSLCEENVLCDLDEIRTTCEEHEDFNRIDLVAQHRRKRAAGTPATDTAEATAAITRRNAAVPRTSGGRHRRASIKFDFTLEGTVNSTGNSAARQRGLRRSMKRLLKGLQSQAKDGHFDLYLSGRWLRFSDMDFDAQRLRNACPQGSVLVNNTCVQCPVGMFYNVIRHECHSCPQGTYQPVEGRMTCLVCPEKTSTSSQHARSQFDCRAQCLPGSVSATGLESCETCLEGFYQPEYAQTTCLPCPDGSTTVRRGARGKQLCQERCAAGHVSRTGLAPCYPCPHGTYQPAERQTACVKCPDGVDTDHRASTSLTHCLGYQEMQSDAAGAGWQNQQEVLDASECFNSPCQNGAVCIPKGGGLFQCTCARGYEGVYCQSEVDQCKAQPCLNGGSCSPLAGAYTCACRPGFEGKKCERNLDDCVGVPCANGGTCVDMDNAFQCNCVNGFTGSTCERDVNDCADQPCLNGGSCQDDISGYRCACPTGYSGTTCEIEADECLSAPCRNGATCVDEPSTFRCQCVAGYTGTQCEVEVLECASNPCQNGAKCEDLIGAYTCHCQSGFTGQHCETSVDAHYQLDFPSANTGNYAAMKIERPLTALTAAFWMLSDDYDNYGTAFSYAVSSMDNALTLTDYNGFTLYVNQEHVITDVTTNDGYWHHVVITWSSIRGNWKIYVDGLLNDSGFDLSTGRPVPGKGTFVLGQEQDSVGGGFSANEAFVGSMTRFNIWDEELSLSTIESMRTSCAQLHGNIIAWPDVQGALVGNMAPQPSSFCQDCPVPADIEFGSVSYPSLTPGSEVTFSCQRGFNVAGPDNTICLITGLYELDPPACRRVNCGDPGGISNGYFEGWRFSFDARVHYKCQRGYKLRGAEAMYCNEYAEWQGDKPECVEITCTVPPLSDNTVLATTRTSDFGPGDEAVFQCGPGHRLLTAHDSVTCQSDGTWDRSVPTCDAQTCATPPYIPDGEPDTARDEYNVGDIVRYMCVFGFTLSTTGVNPTGALSCLPSGEWSADDPECVPVQCDDPPLVAHATMDGDDRTFLALVTYECAPGYEVQGSAYVECLETGLWDPLPPRCEPVFCGPPPDLPHGQVEGKDFTFSAIVTSSCAAGHRLEGAMRRRCGEEGAWEGPDPVCQPLDCGPLAAPANGAVRAPVTTFQAEAVYECDAGHDLQGDASRTCREDGTWSREEPACPPVTCPPLTDIQHGSYQRPAALTFGAHVQYSCQHGYVMEGEAELTCQAVGAWSSQVPACRPVQCPVPAQPGHGAAAVKGTIYTSKVEYTCEPGHNLEGEDVRTCEADGAWTGEEPVCVPITCDPPPLIANGRYEYKDLKVGSVVRYTCDSGHRLQGTEVRRCLDSLALSDTEPTCVPVTCPAPSPPPQGDVALSPAPSSPAGLRVGGRATFSCRAGHRLVGDETRTCGEDGALSGDSPVCRPVDCVKPGEIISNGRMLGLTFTFSSVIRYECDEGYRLQGDRSRLCRADGTWNTTIPSCAAVECPRSPFVANGSPSTFQRTFGTVLTYTCRTRHRLEGPAQRTCLADGAWSGESPRCVKIVCPPPLAPENGRAQQSDDQFLLYVCDEGFRLEGSSAAECVEEGVWRADTPPSCVRVTCPDISSDILLNGFVVYDASFGDYGSSVQYECSAGHSLQGAARRRCSASGQWEDQPPTCRIVSCPPLQDLLNGAVVGEGLTFGAVVTYECDEGHERVGAAARRCQADGLWGGEEPRCEPVTCPPVSTFLVNGAVTSSQSRAFGSQLSYTCNAGFSLQGQRSRTCTALGQWSAGEPVCVSLQCPTPPSVDRGTVNGEDFRMGRTVTYSCNSGFLPVGPTVLLCLPNLMWTGTAPVCERVSCTDLAPAPHLTPIGDGRRYGDSVLFLCAPGYELLGPQSVRCQMSGAWDADPPECIPVSCGLPPMIDHAVMNPVNGTMYPAVVTYVCDPGYEPEGGGGGGGATSCQTDGSWSTPDIACQLVRCPPLSSGDIYHGTIQGQDFSYGGTVVFSCDEGYSLEGERSATCLAQGVWSAEVPACRRVTCPEPDPIFQGAVSRQGVDYNHTATYNCSVGYRLTGEPVARCLASGRWSQDFRECLLVTCPPPPESIAHGALRETKLIFIYQDTVVYECEAGWELVGTGVLTCTADGLFDPAPPSCAKIRCPSPQTPSHGLVQVLDDNLVYSCVPGYELAGNPQRRCLTTGQWEGAAPVCIAILCPPPPDLTDGFYRGIDFQYGSAVTYACDAGFELRGASQRVCLAYRAWSGMAPVCERLSCGDPAPVEFALVLGDRFLFNDTVTYECPAGFALLGEADHTCLETGVWSGEDPYCEELVCEAPPDVVNATHDVMSSDDDFYYGTVVMYMCDPGHVLTGGSSIFCGEEGTWSQPLPACPPVTCPALPDVEHGSFSGGGEEVSFGGTVRVACAAGRRLVGAESLQCTAAGTWDSVVPVCQLVQCTTPTLQHGAAVLQGQSDGLPPPSALLPGQSLVFTCLLGYRLAGAPSSTCLESGDWTDSAPLCKQVTCGDPPDVSHSRTDSSSSGVHSAGDAVTYTCESGYELEGDATVLCANDGAWSGSAPQCVDVTCDPAPTVDHAAVTGWDAARYSQGSVLAGGWVQYECEEGFTLSGGRDGGRLLCLRGGAWSTDVPRCVHVDCGPPPVPFHASVTSSTMTAGSTATVACNRGYRLPSGDTAMDVACDISGEWAGADLARCDPVDCLQPPDIANTAPLDTNSTTFGSRLAYQCLAGFALTGDGIVECSEAGAWAGADGTRCDPLDCLQPRDIANMAPLDMSDGTTFGSRLAYGCLEGFALTGDGTLECSETGAWVGDESVRCDPVDCLQPPGIASMAPLDTSSSGTTFGSRLAYQCLAGFTLVGDGTLDCSEKGLWVSDGSARCDPVDCLQPREIANMALFDTRSIITTFGSRLAYQCLAGFALIGDGTLECSETGLWVGEDSARCDPVDCLQPRGIANMAPLDTSGGFTFGSRLAYRCLAGFTLTGDGTLVCSETGAWVSDDSARCDPVDCLQPPQIANAASLDAGLSTTFGSRLAYRCLAGYALTGDASVECSEKGAWVSRVGHYAACRPLDCGRPQTNMLIRGSQFTFGSTLTLTCPEGTRAVGPERVTCSADGLWSPAPGRCEQILCPAMLDPVNGFVSTSLEAEGTEVGGSVEVLCQDGFSLVGESVITCLSDGSWNYAPPSCELSRDPNAMCGNTVEAPHAVVPPGSYFPGDTVVLSCGPGYRPEGDLASLCRDDRAWATPRGACRRVSCSAPAVDRRQVMVFGRSYLYGDTVMYMCRPGLSPVSLPPTLTCTQSGHWDGEARCAAQCKLACQNGGRCAARNLCKCRSGFTGRQCQIPICVLPCLNGGVCQGPYRCSCPEGYYGSRCQKARCDQPCQHGGRCLHPNRCQCFSGYKPPFCETTIFGVIQAN